MLEKDKILIHELVYKSLEGEISEVESRHLSSLLASDPQALAYYQTCVEINRGLVRIRPILSDSLSMNLCLEEMAEYENKAEVIEIQPPRSARPRIQVDRNAVSVPVQKSSKLSLYVAVMSTAALLLILLYVHLNPRPGREEVAVLADAINADWANPDDSVRIGSRLAAGQGACTLKEGVIKMLYDDGVQVVIEAPAEYELLTSTEIALNYGNLYATVTEAGKGFTVRTQNSRIIDLGTEFGVRAGTRGDTELHVFKGMTTLIAGKRNTEKELVEVHAGQARQVDVYNADIKAIQLDQKTFARSIDSQTRTIWRGEATIELAHTLQGRLVPVCPAFEQVVRTDPQTGGILFSNQSGDDAFNPGFFLPVDDNPFVNGIFVPNGADGPVSLSADGSIRWNAPEMPVRQKIGLLRFNLASYAGSRSGASLRLYVRDVVGLGKPVAVYGLFDESADNWSETAVSYANAPGFRPASLGRYDIDTAAWKKLGTIAFDRGGANDFGPDHVDLDRLLEADTNSLVTVAIVCENSDPSAEWRLTSKEGDPAEAPALVFGAADGSEIVINTTGGGADTYLSNDNQYNIVNTADPHGRETSFRVRNYWKDFILITDAGSFTYKDRDCAEQVCRLRLENRPVGTQDNPVIALKSGAGITFDLSQMQSRVSEARPPRQFSAVCGMPEDILDDAAALTSGYTPRVNVYVLVDGKERFTASGLTPLKGSQRINLPLAEGDRYLTLVVTGAADQKSPFDWCLFVRPRILFE